jgi:hypothetical protein
MIIAQIATIPERERTLDIAARSLYPQVHLLKVIRNSKSDGKKFTGLGNYKPDDIIIVCDDDIEYPPDFVETLLSYLKPGIVVTVMGKIMKPRPIENYYTDFETCYRTFSEVEELVQVEVPGTCGLAFHRSTCPDLDDTYFKSINSDVWMAVYCKEKSIPAYVIPHKADWLKNLMPLLPKKTPSVFDRFEFNCQHMTDLINTI